jgi:hypothetical protein
MENHCLPISKFNVAKKKSKTNFRDFFFLQEQGDWWPNPQLYGKPGKPGMPMYYGGYDKILTWIWKLLIHQALNINMKAKRSKVVGSLIHGSNK